MSVTYCPSPSLTMPFTATSPHSCGRTKVSEEMREEHNIFMMFLINCHSNKLVSKLMTTLSLIQHNCNYCINVRRCWDAVISGYKPVKPNYNMSVKILSHNSTRPSLWSFYTATVVVYMNRHFRCLSVFPLFLQGRLAEHTCSFIAILQVIN